MIFHKAWSAFGKGDDSAGVDMGVKQVGFETSPILRADSVEFTDFTGHPKYAALGKSGTAA